MAAPLWFRPAVGPLLRGGADLRHYRGQFLLHGLFRPAPDELSWLDGMRLRARCRVVGEPSDLSRPPDLRGNRPTLVQFRGYRDFFTRLNGSDALLARRLAEITRREHLVRVARLGAVHVAMNVRIGNDFSPAAPGARTIRPGDKTPLAWFVRTLEVLRETAGWRVPAVVVSDGSPSRLRDLLRVDGVTLLRPGCAISDLFVLSRARILLASGSSSFSAWGAFLGQMPVASHPGQPMSEWRIAPRRAQFVGEVDPEAPATAFLDDVRACLAGDA
jgi:hypothetical protein